MAVRRTMNVSVERFALAGQFTISRGSRTEIVVVTVGLCDGTVAARGECVPYARYGETVESVQAAIEGLRPAFERGELDCQSLQDLLPAGAARNAIDCALWDWEAGQTGRSVQDMAGCPTLDSCLTAYTLSLGTPESMHAVARQAAYRPLLKVKLGGAGDDQRIRAVRAGAPDSTLIVDANESWQTEVYHVNMTACVAAGVALVEQPLPADDDQALATLPRPIPVCADESLHTRADLARLCPLYDAVNIKLDKTGGLSEALHLQRAAREAGFEVMMGCMLGTSLSMAPALLVAQAADYVDLDGPLLLREDRDPPLQFDGSLIFPPDPALWGYGRSLCDGDEPTKTI